MLLQRTNTALEIHLFLIKQSKQIWVLLADEVVSTCGLAVTWRLVQGVAQTMTPPTTTRQLGWTGGGSR